MRRSTLSFLISICSADRAAGVVGLGGNVVVGFVVEDTAGTPTWDSGTRFGELTQALMKAMDSNGIQNKRRGIFLSQKDYLNELKSGQARAQEVRVLRCLRVLGRLLYGRLWLLCL